MMIGDLDESRDVRLLRRDRTIDIGEEMRGRLTRCHGDHLPAARAETEPMYCPGRQVHQRAGFGDHVFVADAERDIALHHVKRFIPRVAVRWRPAAFRACLAKDLLTAGLGTRREDRDLLAGDIERSRRGCRRDHEWCGHGSPPCIVWTLYRLAVISFGRSPNGRPIHPSRQQASVASLANSRLCHRETPWSTVEPTCNTRRPNDRLSGDTNLVMPAKAGIHDLSWLRQRQVVDTGRSLSLRRPGPA